jgi:hypothetical protein
VVGGGWWVCQRHTACRVDAVRVRSGSKKNGTAEAKHQTAGPQRSTGLWLGCTALCVSRPGVSGLAARRTPHVAAPLDGLTSCK